MAKDLTDLNVQGTPEIRMPCVDCVGEGDEEPKDVFGTVSIGYDRPHDALCEAHYRFRQRYFGMPLGDHKGVGFLTEVGPPSDTDADGTFWVRRICPRCGGAGQVGGFQGTCFRCWGYRWTWVCPLNVRRVMRASATFQANRIPKSQEQPR